MSHVTVSHVECYLLQIPLGRQCVDQYKEFGRYNVFSHEELLLKMVFKADTLRLNIAENLYQDLQVIEQRFPVIHH